MNFTVKKISAIDYKYTIIYIKELNFYFTVPKNVKIGALNVDIQGSISLEDVNKLIEKYDNKKLLLFEKLVDKLSLKDGDEYNTPKNAYPLYSICLHPSRKCNLSCTYCFAKKNYNLKENEINIEIAKKAVDFILEYGKNGRRYTVDISGSGEPLLKFDFIKELEEYCEHKRNITGKDIKIMFPTNGTLLNKEMVDYFNKKPNILVGVSIDGDFNQNKNRKLKNGKYAYKKTIEGISMLKNQTIGLAATISHNNEDVDSVYDNLHSKYKNVDAISMIIVRDFKHDSKTSFYDIDLNNLIFHYKKLINNFFTHIENGDFSYIEKLFLGVDKFARYTLRILAKGNTYKIRCGAARNVFSVDYDGNIYACTVALGDDRFLIGNINDGLDVKRQSVFLNLSPESNSKCNKCWASYICGGECSFIAQEVNNSYDEPVNEVCNYTKALISTCISFVQKLELSYPNEYLLLEKFSLRKTFFESVIDSGLWCCIQLFKALNINFSYSEVMEKLISSEFGTTPDELERLLKYYDKKICAIEIDNYNELFSVDYPFIAYINRVKNSFFYEYIYIDKILDGYVYARHFSEEVVNKIRIDIFINEYSNILFALVG